MLAVFGLGLSARLLMALVVGSAQRFVEWLAGYSRRVPTMVGILFIAIGAWSIWFGITAGWARI